MIKIGIICNGKYGYDSNGYRYDQIVFSNAVKDYINYKVCKNEAQAVYIPYDGDESKSVMKYDVYKITEVSDTHIVIDVDEIMYHTIKSYNEKHMVKAIPMYNILTSDKDRNITCMEITGFYIIPENMIDTFDHFEKGDLIL